MEDDAKSTADTKGGDPQPEAAAVKRMRPGPIICPGHSRPVPHLEFSRIIDEGVFLLSACLDGKPMLREGDTGDWIGTFDGHKGAVWSASFNHDTTRVITASAEFTCILWDGVSGEKIHDFLHNHIVKTAVFSTDGQQFYSGGHEKKIRIFDLEKYDKEPMEMRGHSKSITQILQCPTDVNRIISAGDDQNIRIWDKRTLEIVKECPTAGPVNSLEANGENPILVSTSKRFVQFWNTENYELIKEFELSPEPQREQGRDNDDSLLCASLDPKRKIFVTGGKDGVWVHEWNYDTGKEIGVQKGHHGPVRAIAFNPRGGTYASGSEDGSIRIWDV